MNLSKTPRGLRKIVNACKLRSRIYIHSQWQLTTDRRFPASAAGSKGFNFQIPISLWLHLIAINPIQIWILTVKQSDAALTLSFLSRKRRFTFRPLSTNQPTAFCFVTFLFGCCQTMTHKFEPSTQWPAVGWGQERAAIWTVVNCRIKVAVEHFPWRA